VLSTYSYILLSDSDALIIDPGRDTAIYQETIKKYKATVKGFFERHQRGKRLFYIQILERTEKDLYRADSVKASFGHCPLQNGSSSRPDLFCAQTSFKLCQYLLIRCRMDGMGRQKRTADCVGNRWRKNGIDRFRGGRYRV
jgi:hypothetical protein